MMKLPACGIWQHYLLQYAALSCYQLFPKVASDKTLFEPLEGATTDILLQTKMPINQAFHDIPHSSVWFHPQASPTMTTCNPLLLCCVKCAAVHSKQLSEVNHAQTSQIF